MRRFALGASVWLLACSGPGTPRPAEPAVPADPASDPEAVAAATQLMLAGQPATAAERLRARAGRLDANGLVVLGRAELASGHAAQGRHALEQAVERSDQEAGRGRWFWQPSDLEPAIRMAFSPDGRLVAMDGTGQVRVWDIAAGHEVASLETSIRNGITVSPDGRHLIIAGGNGPVEVWNIAVGAVKTKELHLAAPVAFTSDGHLLVRDPRTSDIVELELSTERAVARFGGDTDDILVEGTTVVTWHVNHDATDVVVWERGTDYRKLREFQVPGAIWFLDRTPRGEFVIGTQDNLTIGDLQAGKTSRSRLVITNPRGGSARTLVATGGEPAAVSSAGALLGAAISPDHERLVFTTSDGVATLLELATGRVVRKMAVGGSRVAFHPDGTLLAVAGADGFSLWNVETGARTLGWNRRSAVRALAFDGDGQRLAIGNASGTATMWNLTNNAFGSVTPHAGAPVERLAWGQGVLATGSQVARESIGGRSIDLVAVWNLDGKRAWSRELERLAWLGYRPGPGTNTLATASLLRDPGTNDTAVTLWDAGGVQQRITSLGAAAPFAWSADGSLAHAWDHGIAIRPAAEVAAGSAAPRSRLDVDATELAFQPGGKLLAVGERSGRLSFWEPGSGHLVSAVVDEAGAAAALAWSPDGAFIASAAGTTVRLWDPRATTQLAMVTARARVTALAFHPGGRFVAVGCDDGTVELWAVATATLVATLAVTDADRGIVLAPDGTVDGTLAASDPLFWRVGGVKLPGLGAWERAHTPGLLAARLAMLPAETTPRADLRVAAEPPPACVTDADRQALTSWRVANHAIEVCVAPDFNGNHLPACFTLDLASGTYHPRVPLPYEALGKAPPVDPAVASAERDGIRVKVCRSGSCRVVDVPELHDIAATLGAEASLTVNDDASLLAVCQSDFSSSEWAVVYDVASGRRVSRFSFDRLFDGPAEAARFLRFLNGTLLVVETPCAGPCSRGVLVDPRTGKLIAPVGVRGKDTLSGVVRAQVGGDVFAFTEWNSPAIAYQDIRTGQVVRRFGRPVNCTGDMCEVAMLHAGAGIALTPQAGKAGDITLIDARGKITARHRLPLCK